jgi:hypothetical protein
MDCSARSVYPFVIPIRPGKGCVQFMDQEVRAYYTAASRKQFKPTVEAARFALSDHDLPIGSWKIVKYGRVDPKDDPLRSFVVLRFLGTQFTRAFHAKPTDAERLLARAIVVGARLHLELRVGRQSLRPVVLDLKHTLV